MKTLQSINSFIPSVRDYILAQGCLYFAVVSNLLENDCVLCWLRYYQDQTGIFHKLNTATSANQYLSAYPAYLVHSKLLDVLIHAVPMENIQSRYCPREGLQRVLYSGTDLQCLALRQFVQLLEDKGISSDDIGIAGSLLIGAHSVSSDIDMLVYGRENFIKVQEYIKVLCETTPQFCLTDRDWYAAYLRRDCELSFSEYCTYERRKFNKIICNRIKIDVSLAVQSDEYLPEYPPYKKINHMSLVAKVSDDRYSYDYPARYQVMHDQVSEVVSYTATYVGQALSGEEIEVSGYLEEDAKGNRRLLVGTSRSAQGEYIRVKGASSDIGRQG